MSNPIPPLRTVHTAVVKEVYEPYEKVLVRKGPGDAWVPAFYACQQDGKHRTISGAVFPECLPFEGNELLAFTDADPVLPSPFTGAQVVAVTEDPETVTFRKWKIRLYKHRSSTGEHCVEDPDSGRLERWPYCTTAESVWNCTLGPRAGG